MGSVTSLPPIFKRSLFIFSPFPLIYAILYNMDADFSQPFPIFDCNAVFYCFESAFPLPSLIFHEILHFLMLELLDTHCIFWISSQQHCHTIVYPRICPSTFFNFFGCWKELDCVRKSFHEGAKYSIQVLREIKIIPTSWKSFRNWLTIWSFENVYFLQSTLHERYEVF